MSASAAGVATDQTNFPVLIRLTDGLDGFSFSELGNPDGRDIRFTDSTGAVNLPYQLDRCTSPNLEAWVLVPLVKGTTSGITTRIKMYWGNSSATSLSSGAAVFTQANGYAGVWHLGDAGTGARADATANGFSATTYNYSGTESTPNGDIGRADSLKGEAAADATYPPSADYMKVTSNMGDWSKGITYSAWLYPTANLAETEIVDFNADTTGPSEGWQACDNILFYQPAAGGILDIEAYNNRASQGVVTSTATFTTGAWHHYAFTISNGTAVTIYKDGVSAGTGTLTPLASEPG